MAEIIAGGKARTLKYDVFALSELELRSDKHLGWFIQEIQERRCGPAMAVWLLWAGLQHETPPPSKAEAVALVTAHLNAGGVTFDWFPAFVMALSESDLFRSRPNRQPDVTSPPVTSGSGTGSAPTSPSSMGASAIDHGKSGGSRLEMSTTS